MLQDIVCASCSGSFTNKFTLLKHIKTVHTENNIASEKGSFLCDSCGGYFADKTQLRKHIKSGHIENVIIQTYKTVLCTTCDKSFVSFYWLGVHFKNHHKNILVTDKKELCIQCDEFFDSIYLLETHLKEVHKKNNNGSPSEEKLLVCSFCNEYFLSKYTLQNHLRIVHKENIPDCPFKRKTKLCTFCGKYFTSAQTLRNHKKVIHKVVIPIFKNKKTEECTACGKYFINKHTLRTHLKTIHNENIPIVHHKNEKKVSCNSCGKSFVGKKTLCRHLKNLHKDEFPVAPIKKTVSCAHCNNLFVNKYTLREHLKRVHKLEITTCQKRLICHFCGKFFTSRNTLVTHLKKVHDLAITRIINNEKTKICSMCGKCFANNFTLREHLRRIHKEDISLSAKNKTKLCTNCGKSFVNNFTLRGHLKRIHNEDVPPPLKNKTITCSICSKSFTKFSSYRKHMKNIHRQELSEHHPPPKKEKPEKPAKEKTYRRCALCNTTADAAKEMLFHYENKHNLNMSYQKYTFDNEENFQRWKIDIENSTRCSFKTNYSNKKTSGILVVYWCNRTGCFVSRSTGKRQIRTIGSKKINSFCPAHMRVEFTSNGVTVKFISEHVGHETNQLCHMNLSKLERDEIVKKLRNGVPPREILRSMKYPLPASKADWKRIHLLTVRDIRYIGKRFGVYRPFGRHSHLPSTLKHGKNNDTSVDMWVSSNEDAVLYYKKKGCVDERFPFLKSDDVVLIIMSVEQTEALKTWGENVLAIDCTRDLNNYNFILTSVIVLDECSRAFGSCFMFSNDINENFLNVLFEGIKSEVGTLNVKTFLDDMTDECFNAWKKVFPEPKFHLYCPWQVLRKWRDDLNKISPKDVLAKFYISENELFVIKKQTYRFLKMNLLRERNEVTFENELNNFLKQNVLLHTFQKYFIKCYLPKKQLWAFSFRKYAGINGDMIMDSFYKILKYCLGNRKKIKNIDDALQAVFEYLNKKLEKEIIAEEKGSDDYKIAISKIRHKKSLTGNFNTITPDETGWLVESGCGKNRAKEIIAEVHFIEKLDFTEDCVNCRVQCVDCKVCIHQFRCTCADSAVLMNMCKHIHLLCRYLNRRSIVDSSAGGERVTLSWNISSVYKNEISNLQPVQEEEVDNLQPVYDDEMENIEIVENVIYEETVSIVEEVDDVIEHSVQKEEMQ